MEGFLAHSICPVDLEHLIRQSEPGCIIPAMIVLLGRSFQPILADRCPSEGAFVLPKPFRGCTFLSNYIGVASSRKPAYQVKLILCNVEHVIWFNRCYGATIDEGI